MKYSLTSNTALHQCFRLFNSRCCPASDWWCEISQGLGPLPKIALGMGKNMEVDSMDEMMKLSQETNIFYHWKKNLSSSKLPLKQDMLVPRYARGRSLWAPYGLVRVLGRRRNTLLPRQRLEFLDVLQRPWWIFGFWDLRKSLNPMGDEVVIQHQHPFTRVYQW